MILNVLHRPKMSDAYFFQQETTHKLGIKTTLMVLSDMLEDKEIIESVKKDHEKYGDEIGIWITSMPNSNIQEFPWLHSHDMKRELVEYSIDTYKRIYGEAPKVAGSYLMDSELLMMLKEYCPEITTVVAGCFEEGTKVYHGCNNSWYLFSEGMAWGPWYPSKNQSLRPAKNNNDWSGVVAVPHLSRDLVLAYEGRDDFFASHPANIQRGLANDGAMHNYDYNLVDQYRMQELYNDGISYYQLHVGESWLMAGHPMIYDSQEVSRQLYYETLKYLADLRDEGKVQDMYMSEFGAFYEKNVPIEKPVIGVGKDILYGSDKQYFWYFSPEFRVLVDMYQSGSIGDLRPYISEFASHTGPDSPMLDMNSYPFLIQSQIRAGYKNHFSDGSRTTAFVEYNGEKKDLCCYRTKIKKVTRTDSGAILELAPVTVEFESGNVEVQTVYTFSKDGTIAIERRILNNPDKEVYITEYVKASYGFTEYPLDMKGIKLISGDKSIDYKYEGRRMESKAESAAAIIPQINTRVELCGREAMLSSITEGHLFSPFFTLEVKQKVNKDDMEVLTWLKISKEK